MTPQQQLAFIKEKVIEAVPSILDLKFSCQVKLKGEKNHIFTIGSDNLLGREVSEIIGRPITLPDVLLAIGKNVKPFPDLQLESIQLDISKYGSNGMDNCLWNLLLPLDGQKEEVWAFLAELLK